MLRTLVANPLGAIDSGLLVEELKLCCTSHILVTVGERSSPRSPAKLEERALEGIATETVLPNSPMFRSTDDILCIAIA